jgi:hypothetical protein
MFALGLVLLAGCAGPKPDTTSGASAGSITGVTIEPPLNLAAGERSVVCWNVQGTGTVPHVAIHWASTSQASKPDRKFSDYTFGAAYPDNASALNPSGYALPGRFCTAVTVPATGPLYIVGHAMVSAPGKISDETTLRAVGGGRVESIESPTGPNSAAPNSDVEICWIIKGTGNVAHVAIHWAYQSQAGRPDRKFSDYDKGAAYPNNTATLDRDGYELQPGGVEYCANVHLPVSGTVYIVGHAIDRNGAPGILSGEKSIVAG